MDNQRALEFRGTASGYFAAVVVTVLTFVGLFFGWAYAFNYVAKWVIESTRVNGQKVRYTATYGKTLEFVFVSFLLLIITVGIYGFWLGPKTYRYAMDHTEYIPDAPVVMDSVFTPTVTTPEQVTRDTVAASTDRIV